MPARTGPYWAAVQFAGPVRKAVHRLKFESRSDLGRPLGEELSRRVKEWSGSQEGRKVELVTCIPLSDHRLAERGFNQAGLLAREVARSLGVPFQPRALTRLRETSKQSSLGRDARLNNVEGAFQATPSVVRGKVVILVDDVVTTGETLGAAARALVAAGANEVVCVALARAGSSMPDVRSELHDGSDRLSCVHHIEGFVDSVERELVRNQAVDVDLLLHVPVDDLGHVRASTRPTKG